MIKQFFLATALALSLPLCASGAKSSRNDATKPAVVNTSGTSTDSLTVNDGDSLTPITASAIPQAATPSVVEIDDHNYVLANGYAYRLDDLSDTLDELHDINAFNSFEPFNDVDKDKHMVPVIAICFIVPCVTLIICLVLLLMFFMKKTAARNSVIEKAIDAGYQLPDSFYSAPTSFSNLSGADANDQNGTTADKKQAPTRDPKNFQSAVTLLAVGFACLLFFAYNDSWGIAFLAGGIPLLLGVGKLIGYFYIPGYNSEKRRQPTSQPPFNQPGNYPQQPPYNRQPNQPPYPGAYPPPFNGQSDNNRPTTFR